LNNPPYSFTWSIWIGRVNREEFHYGHFSRRTPGINIRESPSTVNCELELHLPKSVQSLTQEVINSSTNLNLIEFVSSNLELKAKKKIIELSFLLA